LDDRFSLRVAIGNIHTRRAHLDRLWKLLTPKGGRDRLRCRLKPASGASIAVLSAFYVGAMPARTRSALLRLPSFAFSVRRW
jgi:hypothetical protein